MFKQLLIFSLFKHGIKKHTIYCMSLFALYREYMTTLVDNTRINILLLNRLYRGLRHKTKNP